MKIHLFYAMQVNVLIVSAGIAYKISITSGHACTYKLYFSKIQRNRLQLQECVFICVLWCKDKCPILIKEDFVSECKIKLISTLLTSILKQDKGNMAFASKLSSN